MSGDPAGRAGRLGDAKRPGGGGQRRGGGMTWHAGPGDRPGDPACLLPRVCQACGAVAGQDPPTTCPQCGSEIPGG